jgi:hypothetical protein
MISIGVSTGRDLLRVGENMRMLTASFALLLTCSVASAADAQWRPSEQCVIAERSSEGLVPDARTALANLGLVHRITQTLNASRDAANYHGGDTVVDGKPVTAAVDISVRCLDEGSVKELLSALANAGFAAWYRRSGADSWTGATHVHAVWAREPLKRQLRAQVQSWLVGKTGLVGDKPYTFWKASDAQRAALNESYERSRQ